MKRKRILTAPFFSVLLVSALSSTLFLNLGTANFLTVPPPEVTVVSPIPNGTYYQRSIPINVKVETMRLAPNDELEQLAWLNYSIDGRTDVALFITNESIYKPEKRDGKIGIGSGTLSGLSEGNHNLVIRGETTYSKYSGIPDARFIMTVYFTVKEPSLTTLFIMASGASATVVGIGLFTYFKKSKRHSKN